MNVTSKIILIGCLVTSSLLSVGQAPNLDTVKARLYRINKVFDSSAYLGFDVGIRYTSDTLYGKFENEELNGTYILNNRNIYYRMGDAEYAQNDSFAYNIYHDEKMLLMTKDIPTTNSSLFPLKEFVDSVITWYGSLYTISLGKDDDSHIIEFKTNADTLPYKRFAIYYDSSSYYPDRFEMTMFGEPDISTIPDTVLAMIKIKKPVRIEKKISISFSNYHNPLSLDVFSNTQYVYYDRMRKRYQPASRLKGYRFISNGVNGDDQDESVEIYPQPPDGQ